MASVWIAFLVAQAAASFAGLDAAWTPVTPLANGEYAHFSRQVPNAPAETLVGLTQKCDCEPAHVIDGMADALKVSPLAVIRRDSATVCGASAQHIVAVGVADVTGRKNFDIYAFRNGDALVLISYFFTKASSSDADEASMQAICPPAASSAVAITM